MILETYITGWIEVAETKNRLDFPFIVSPWPTSTEGLFGLDNIPEFEDIFFWWL